MDALLSQLEIAFWNTLIPLMGESRFVQALVRKVYPLLQQRRLIRLSAQLFSGLGLVLFLALSVRTVQTWLASRPAPQAEAAAHPLYPVPAQPDVSPLPTGQRNLLLITADDLQSPHPHLESVWLALYVPPDAKMTLMPIYPAEKGTGIQNDALARLFSIKNDKGQLSLNEAFFTRLSEDDYWWTGYAVLDRQALVEVMDLMGQNGSAPLPDNEIPEQVRRLITGDPTAPIKVEASQLHQAAIYQEMCWRASQASSPLGFLRTEDLSSRLAGHLIASSAEFTQELLEMQIPSGALYCEFPTIPAQSLASN